MPEIIIGSPDQRMLWIGSEGEIGISGTVSVNNISGSIVIGSVSASVDSVYIQSGDNVNLGSNWKGVGSVYVNNFDDLGSVVVVDAPATIGSLANQTINGSVSISTDPVPISGIVNTELYSGSKVWQGTSPWATLGSQQITNENVPISGVVTVTDLATAGSLATQGIIGSVQVTNSLLQISGDVTISDDSYINVSASGNYIPISGEVGVVFDNDYINVIQSGTNWGVSGTSNVLGSVAISTNPIPISGDVVVSVGSIYVLEDTPDSDIYNNPSWKFVYSGDSIGSIYQFIGTGSYVQVFSYSGNSVEEISNWSVV